VAFIACASRAVEHHVKARNSRVPTHIIHCGIAPSAAKPHATASEAFRILTVARLFPKKGVDTCLRAASLLHRDGESFVWDFVGFGPEGPVLRRLADTLQLTSHLRWVGMSDRTTVFALMEAADAFVLPCRLAGDGDVDGIPVALMEAMTRQLPVVTTSISGIPELVQEEQTGWLVHPNSPDEVAATLRRIRADPDAARARSQRGKTFVDAEFNGEVEAHKLMRVMVEVTSAPVPDPGQ
jgi:colanic acid/amylovoran biosynthesis glycosyltransferase